MGTLSTIRDFAMQTAERVKAAHRRRRTLRAIESLDLHVLKDIGWSRNGTDLAPVQRAR